MEGGAITHSIVSSIEKRIALPALNEAEMVFSRALQGITIADLVSRATMGSATCAEGLIGAYKIKEVQA